MAIPVIEKISQSKPSYAIKLFVDNQDRGRMGAQVHKSGLDDTLIAASKCTIFNQKGGNGEERKAIRAELCRIAVPCHNFMNEFYEGLLEVLIKLFVKWLRKIMESP